MQFSKTTTLALAVVWSVLLAAVPADGANETPVKKKVIFWSSTSNPDGSRHEVIFKERAKAEGYTFESYMYKEGDGNPATVEKFYTLAKKKPDYAVFVIFCHGKTAGLAIEEYPATAQGKIDRDDKWDEYTNKDGYKGLWTFNDFGRYLKKRRSGKLKKFCIRIDPQRLRTLFDEAVVPENSIIFLGACYGWNMDNLHKVFDNHEFFSMKQKIHVVKAGNAFHEVMKNMSGETARKLSNERPVNEAFDAGSKLAEAAKLNHAGDGDITLAPSVEWHLPVVEDVIPLGLYPGQVTFDTTMDKSKDPNKAIVFEVDHCLTVLADRRWSAVPGEPPHVLEFKLMPTIPRWFVLKVDPAFAVSDKNKDIKLIGNRFLPGAAGVGEWPDPRTRIAIEVPDYANNGYDGANQTTASPVTNPYRWRVWCENDPEEHPNVVNAPYHNIREPINDVDVPVGEARGFTIMDSEPGTGITFATTNGPANFSVDNPAAPEWYGYVTFEPESAQLGNTYTVTLDASDSNGLRVSRDVDFTVVARNDCLSVSPVYFYDSDEVAFPFGQDVAYEYDVYNNGNTLMRNVVVSVGSLVGPETIGSGSIAVQPSSIDPLMPGSYETVTITITTNGVDTAGVYAGTVQVDAETAENPNYATNGTIELRLDHPPEITGTNGVLPAYVGTPLSIDLTASDADLDELTYYIDVVPEEVTLTTNGTGVHFAWQPGPKDTGPTSMAVVADDGFLDPSFFLEIDVEGPINVDAIPVPDTYIPFIPLPVDVYYVNNNTVTATLASETVQAFAGGFDNILLYSNQQFPNQNLAPEEELLRQIMIPPPGGPPQPGLYVRITAQTDINTNAYSHSYTDVSEFMFPDCNLNNLFDSMDIISGTSDDYDFNGVPDECDPDCNTNGAPDACDLNCGTGNCAAHPSGCGAGTDCQPDGVLDECQLFDNDCNTNGIPDECDMNADGDFDADGDVDLDDFAVFVDCANGPGEAPNPPSPGCVAACLGAFDFNVDSDVDLEDFALFQQVYGSP